MLPADHPKRTDAQLDSAVRMLESGDTTACAERILKPMMEETQKVMLFSSSTISGCLDVCPMSGSHLVPHVWIPSCAPCLDPILCSMSFEMLRA